jgi:hypothetical protein
MATAVSRGLIVVAGLLVLTAVGTGTAAAATGGSGAVVSDSMDVGIAGTVGVVAVLVGVVGFVLGFTRRHRQSLARKAAERPNQ